MSFHDESGWSVEELEAWVAAANEQFTSAMGWDWQATHVPSLGRSKADLLKEVSARLDQLYEDFQPQYISTLKGVDASQLPPWEVLPDVLGAAKAQMPWIKPANPLTRCFNTGRSHHEWMSHSSVGKEIPCGKHPLDDWRQLYYIVCENFPADPTRVYHLVDLQQRRECLMSVRDIRLLLPGASLKPGTAVVVVQAAGGVPQSGALDPYKHLCGLQGEVQGQVEGAATSTSTSTCGGQQGAGHGNTPAMFRVRITTGLVAGEVVDIPPHRLMVVGDRCGNNRDDVPLPKSMSQAAGPGPHRQEDWVVVQGLEKRPDLNGRPGLIVEVDVPGAKGVPASDETRCQVQLLEWGRPLADGLYSLMAEPFPEPCPTVRVRWSNLVKVQQPPPVILAAFATHKAGSPELQQLLDVESPRLQAEAAARGKLALEQRVQCTQREMELLARGLQDSARALAPLPLEARKKLLGRLDPARWQLVAITPTRPPVSPSIVAKRQLKQELACRQCGTSGVRLMTCKGCGDAQYCSRECQAADWKARHKQECAARKAKQGSQQGAGSSGQEQQAEGCPPAKHIPGTVVIDIMAAMPDELKTVQWRTGAVYDLSRLPRNLHGEAEFVMKAQNAVDPMLGIMVPVTDNALWGGDIMLYDQPRVLTVHVTKAKNPAEHAALMAIIRQHGQRGVMNQLARKAYVYAKRQGKDVRIVVDRLPPQQQRW